MKSELYEVIPHGAFFEGVWEGVKMSSSRSNVITKKVYIIILYEIFFFKVSIT
jgi:hypothetical protein